MSLLREYVKEVISQNSSEKLLRKSVQSTLKEIMAQIASEPAPQDDGPSIPEPDDRFIEKTAVIWMKWAHRKELIETFERWKPFVERAGAGNNDKDDRLKAYEELLGEIKNPLTYMANAEKASQYWVGLASLVPKQQQGQVMGERLAFRQGFVDETLDKINGWIKEAASSLWEKFSENPVDSTKALYEIWKALPNFESDISNKSNVPSKAMIIGSFTYFIISALGKRALGLTGPLALISAITALGQYFGYKSRLVSKADDLIGDSSVTLSNQYLPASFHKMDFLKGAGGLAAGIISPTAGSDAEAIRKAQEEQERKMWGN